MKIDTFPRYLRISRGCIQCTRVGCSRDPPRTIPRGLRLEVLTSRSRRQVSEALQVLEKNGGMVTQRRVRLEAVHDRTETQDWKLWFGLSLSPWTKEMNVRTVA